MVVVAVQFVSSHRFLKEAVSFIHEVVFPLSTTVVELIRAIPHTRDMGNTAEYASKPTNISKAIASHMVPTLEAPRSLY